jgi:glutathione S-transferase
MTPANEPPRLLHFRVSHYNEKVRWALDYKRWPHRRQALVPGFHLARTRWRSGQNQLPVLEIDGRVLAGSDRILAELERLRPDPPLYPPDPAARERALRLQAYFDDPVAPDLRRLFWAAYLDDASACARMATDGFPIGVRRAWRALFPLMRTPLRRNMGIDRERLAAARERLPRYFDRLEAGIGAHGYLVGERFGIADLAAAAVMTAIVRPPQFPYPLPEPWPRALVELRESVADRAGFRWVLDLYARHRGASSEVGVPAARSGATATPA